MLLTRGENSFAKPSTGLESLLSIWVVLSVSLARTPPTATENIADCREVSGYTSGPVFDTCTVQLTLNDTKTDVINSLKAMYQDFPLKCRIRKYILYTLYNSVRKNVLEYFS